MLTAAARARRELQASQTLSICNDRGALELKPSIEDVRSPAASGQTGIDVVKHLPQCVAQISKEGSPSKLCHWSRAEREVLRRERVTSLQQPRFVKVEYAEFVCEN